LEPHPIASLESLGSSAEHRNFEVGLADPFPVDKQEYVEEVLTKMALSW